MNIQYVNLELDQVDVRQRMKEIMSNGKILAKDIFISRRCKEIKEARNHFCEIENSIKDGFTKVLDSASFMDLIKKYESFGNKGYICSDDIRCAFFGFYDHADETCYYCPIEELNEEEISRIEKLKPKFNGSKL